MKPILALFSLAGLALTVAPAFLVFAGRLGWNAHANLMIAGMILWFSTAPFWLGKKPS